MRKFKIVLVILLLISCMFPINAFTFGKTEEEKKVYALAEKYEDIYFNGKAYDFSDWFYVHTYFEYEGEVEIDSRSLFIDIGWTYYDAFDTLVGARDFSDAEAREFTQLIINYLHDVAMDIYNKIHEDFTIAVGKPGEEGLSCTSKRCYYYDTDALVAVEVEVLNGQMHIIQTQIDGKYDLNDDTPYYRVYDEDKVNEAINAKFYEEYNKTRVCQLFQLKGATEETKNPMIVFEHDIVMMLEDNTPFEVFVDGEFAGISTDSSCDGANYYALNNPLDSYTDRESYTLRACKPNSNICTKEYKFEEKEDGMYYLMSWEEDESTVEDNTNTGNTDNKEENKVEEDNNSIGKFKLFAYEELQEYSAMNMNVYPNSRVTSLKSNGNGFTVEGYMFEKDAHCNRNDSSNWREIVFVNVKDPSVSAAYRQSVTNVYNTWLNKNMTATSNGKYDLKYANYKVTVNPNNIRPYRLPFNSDMEEGDYFVYMRISNGKTSYLFPLVDKTLSDGTNMENKGTLPKGFRVADPETRTLVYTVE